MPECTNPVQCQTAHREECTCACHGTNHSILRKGLDSDVPEEQEAAQEKLDNLKAQQSVLKKQHRKERRQRRAEAHKIATSSST